MKLLVIAVGQRVPDWAQTAWADYAKRFPPELRLVCKTVKAEPRSGGKTAVQMMQAEAQRIEAAIPAGTHVVALDERGSALTTAALAAKLSQWQGQGGDVALLIGGPDGLHPALRQAVSFAIDRKVIVQQSYFGEAIPAYTCISPPMSDFYDPNIAKSGRGQFFDLAKAKALQDALDAAAAPPASETAR